MIGKQFVSCVRKSKWISPYFSFFFFHRAIIRFEKWGAKAITLLWEKLLKVWSLNKRNCGIDDSEWSAHRNNRNCSRSDQWYLKYKIKTRYFDYLAFLKCPQTYEKFHFESISQCTYGVPYTIFTQWKFEKTLISSR